ncbi:MAG: type II toxin-antitoxin system VapC family toxin [Candidatus Accumulibacter sp.]|uniref:Ribonuclease VapC n=1 Tax=Candidatus Accumulibacter affinis TaxID=2954384 RepID=A0A935T9Z6_9PROT|nr:type II toxin-antitoxin system VapC family toxin [Candidatus Accumulibacter affinis]
MGDESLIVLDTHALIWWLTGAPNLSLVARQTIAKAVAARQVVVSAISVLEIVTAVRRGRLQFTHPVEQWLADACQFPELRFEPVSAAMAQLAGSFGEEMHGDPADRIIAATAIHYDCGLVTADGKLHAVRALKTVW